MPHLKRHRLDDLPVQIATNGRLQVLDDRGQDALAEVLVLAPRVRVVPAARRVVHHAIRVGRGKIVGRHHPRRHHRRVEVPGPGLGRVVREVAGDLRVSFEA